MATLPSEGNVTRDEGFVTKPIEIVEPLKKEIAYPGQFSDALGREIDLTVEILREALNGSLQLIEAGYRIPGYNDHFVTDSDSLYGYWSAVWINDEGSLEGLFVALNNEIRAKVKKLDCSLVIQDEVKFGTRDKGLVTAKMAITRVDIVPNGAAVGTARFKEEAAMAFSFNSEKLSSKAARVYLAKGEKMETDNKEEAAKSGGIMSLLAAAFGLEGIEASDDLIERLFINQVLGNPDDVGAAMSALVKDGAAAMSAFGAEDLEEALEDVAEEETLGTMSLEGEEAVAEEVASLRQLAMTGLCQGLSEADSAAVHEMQSDIFLSTRNFEASFKAAEKIATYRRGNKVVAALNTARPSSKAKRVERKTNKKPETEQERNFRIAMSSENPLTKALGLNKEEAKATII